MRGPTRVLKPAGSATLVGETRLEQPTLSPVSAAETMEPIRAQMALGDLTNLAGLRACVWLGGSIDVEITPQLEAHP
jgi:hypothetical protein